jgi:tRNA A-37 threonylcarbamoyl transferase component Bud32
MKDLIPSPAQLDWQFCQSSDADPQTVQNIFAEARDQEKLEEVYHVDHRRVFRLAPSPVGPMAVKQVRHLRAAQRFKMRYWKESKGVREYRVMAKFLKRGGRAPRLYAMAEHRSPIALHQVLIFMQWLDESRTLYDLIREDSTDDAMWKSVASTLVDSAKKGLAHGGHSSENIMIRQENGQPTAYIIDFAESQLAPSGEIDMDGFVRDLRRIVRRTVNQGDCSHEQLQPLVDALGECWLDTPGADAVYEDLRANLLSPAGK